MKIQNLAILVGKQFYLSLRLLIMTAMTLLILHCDELYIERPQRLSNRIRVCEFSPERQDCNFVFQSLLIYESGGTEAKATSIAN